MGDISPPSGINSNLVKMQNLKIWKRVLSAPEMQYANPAIATAASFNPDAISPTTSCAAH